MAKLTVYLTTDEKQSIERRAKMAGVSVSQFVRTAALKRTYTQGAKA